MKNILISLLLITFALTPAKAQETQNTPPTIKTNGLYASLGLFSQLVIYERNFAYSKRSAYMAKAGYGLSEGLFGGRSQQVLGNIGMITGKTRKNHFEISGGAALLYNYQAYHRARSMNNYPSSLKDHLEVYPSVYIGYRFQKPEGKFIFRYGIGYPETSAISFGYAF